MDYKIKLELYEGPYELLYHLIKNSKINVYDISFVNIIDQYMEYINHINETNPEIFFDFILITSTLLEIKSKMLLPKIKKEDDINTTDEAIDVKKIDEFYYNLEEYKKYKNVAAELRKIELTENNVFYKTDTVTLNKKNSADISQIAKIYKKYINNFDKQYSKGKKFSIRQKTTYILNILSKVKHITFDRFIKNSKTKEDVISYLIAVLELGKKNFIYTYQSSNFDDILIKRGKTNER